MMRKCGTVDPQYVQLPESRALEVGRVQFYTIVMSEHDAQIWLVASQSLPARTAHGKLAQSRERQRCDKRDTSTCSP